MDGVRGEVEYRDVSFSYNDEAGPVLEHVSLKIAPGEKLCLVIAVGYGTTQGAGHPVKQPEEVSKADSPVPDWFQRGVRAALLAPTAMNQQKFTFTLQGGSVAAKAGTGFYTKVDLGIAKYHFEIGAGTAQFRWAP